MPVLVIDKPGGMSSFAVVKQVARCVRAHRAAGGQGLPDPRRIGHGGTLDPLATGVLPICIGEATKLAAFLLDAHKAYEARLKLGIETDTLDAEGQVLREVPVRGLGPEAVEAALEGFRGPITQLPPMFSALKRDGKPLYAYARQGVEVARTPRAITIFDLQLQAFEPPDVVKLFVRCSKGTYIRVLAADLGQRLGVGAHLTALRRTESGPFSLEQAISLDDLGRRVASTPPGPLPTVGLSEALRHLPALPLTGAQELKVARGQKFAWAEIDPEARVPSGPVRLLRADGSLAAMAQRAESGAVSLLRGFHREDDDVRPNGAEKASDPSGNVNSRARGG